MTSASSLLSQQSSFQGYSSAQQPQFEQFTTARRNVNKIVVSGALAGALTGVPSFSPASVILKLKNSLFANNSPAIPTEGLRFVPPAAVYTPAMTTGGYMERQVDQFMGQLGMLLERYEGIYVAFEDGQVLATGDNIRQVLNEVDRQRGEARPVLVRRVQRDYPPIEM